MFESLPTDKALIELLRSGGIAVIRTDTLYGLVASADDQTAVERVYRVKGRDPHKSCIVLLDSMRSAYGNARHIQTESSPVPTSYLIDGQGAPHWLLRENEQLAYRVPRPPALSRFLALTGPLIAPSANPQGLPPARTIAEAQAYFGGEVDMYVDGGTVPVDTPPSRLLRVHSDGTVERLR